MCTRKQHKENKLEIVNMSFESVHSFKYLGSSVNENNTIEEEIKERLIAGNKAFYENQKMFQNKLLSKKSKLKLYWTLIRPIVTYACETWVLKKKLFRNSWYLKEKYWEKSLDQPKK